MFALALFLLVQVAVLAANRQGESCFPNGAAMESLSGGGFTFWKCRDGKWELTNCPPGYRFSRQQNGCIFNSNPSTPPSPVFCRPGSRIEYIFDNTKFQQCNSDGRGYTLVSCGNQLIFDVSAQGCVYGVPPTRPPTTRYTTTPYYTTSATTPIYGACKESAGRAGYKPDYRNCRKFYQCASGLWTQQSCGEGTIWNQEILTCDHDRGQCNYRPTHRPTIGPPSPPPPTYYPPNNNGGNPPIEV